MTPLYFFQQPNGTYSFKCKTNTEVNADEENTEDFGDCTGFDNNGSTALFCWHHAAEWHCLTIFKGWRYLCKGRMGTGWAWLLLFWRGWQLRCRMEAGQQKVVLSWPCYREDEDGMASAYRRKLVLSGWYHRRDAEQDPHTGRLLGREKRKI